MNEERVADEKNNQPRQQQTSKDTGNQTSGTTSPISRNDQSSIQKEEHKPKPADPTTHGKPAKKTGNASLNETKPQASEQNEKHQDAGDDEANADEKVSVPVPGHCAWENRCISRRVCGEFTP